MLCSRISTDDAGSASLELIVAGVVLLVPLVYLVLAVSSIQAAALAVEGASRQAARVFVQQPDERSAEAAADQAVRVSLSDFGVDADSATVTIDCDAHGCLAPRSFVTVRVAASVPLPLVPPVLDLDVAASVPVSSTATEQVSRFTAADG